jgi:signal transduction histidine kinase
VHDARLLDQPGLLQEATAAARLAIENERLQAELRAQLEELKASRTRIIETGDTARRRLERDLHDGAQQRLLALAYDLHVARARAEAGGEPALATLLTAAADEAQAALGELRDLAHGIYPAILAEAGLAPALQTLADEAPLAVELRDVTAARYGTPIETAAYRTVVESIADAANRDATVVSVDVNREGDRLIVTVGDDGADRTTPLVHVADRVGALGGVVEVGPKEVHAEVPCA